MAYDLRCSIINVLSWTVHENLPMMYHVYVKMDGYGEY